MKGGVSPSNPVLSGVAESRMWLRSTPVWPSIMQ
jgi:hypothetical protein